MQARNSVGRMLGLYLSSRWFESNRAYNKINKSKSELWILNSLASIALNLTS